MIPALNLSRRPFRNERLPTLLLAGGLSAVALLSSWHALAVRDIRPGGTRDVAGEVASLEREIEALRAESAELGRLNAPRETIEKWRTVKGLVDRRVFSWTGLFAALETVLPPSVRLASVAPEGGDGPLVLSLAAVGRSVDDAHALLKALQEQREFEAPFLESVNDEKDGVGIVCTVRYVGARTAPPPSPRAGQGAAEATSGGANGGAP